MFITKNIVYCNKQITGNYTETSKALCSEGYEYCWMGCMPAPTCGSGQQLSCFNNQDVECCSTYNDEPCEDMDGIYHYFTQITNYFTFDDYINTLQVLVIGNVWLKKTQVIATTF